MAGIVVAIMVTPAIITDTVTVTITETTIDRKFTTMADTVTTGMVTREPACITAGATAAAGTGTVAVAGVSVLVSSIAGRSNKNQAPPLARSSGKWFFFVRGKPDALQCLDVE